MTVEAIVPVAGIIQLATFPLFIQLAHFNMEKRALSPGELQDKIAA